jgi:Na+/alanine symporter
VEYLANKYMRRQARKVNGNEKNKFVSHTINAYRIIFLITTYLGAVISLNLVWDLADIFNALMAIPNLLSLLFLSGIIVHETIKYLWRGRLYKE